LNNNVYKILKMAIKYNTVVFDFGGVLIDWDRRYLYKKVFEDEEEMEWFLRNVCSDGWNNLQDEGIPFSESIPELQMEFPEYCDKIAMYESRWSEMVGGEISGSVEILREIQAKNFLVYGLTNWGADTFPIVLKQFEFLRNLDGIVVSGDEKKVKPYPEIYQILIDRYQIKPESCIFIDDNYVNIESAKKIGFKAIQFVSPKSLREHLMLLKVL
jgi:2-haloacid dehalogenase